jgi:CO/xanthine dehydrogenase Mo-binding subunit
VSDPIGTSPPRPDGLAKAAGTARYADDLQLPGMIFGATVRSPHAHAKIDAVRFHRGRAPEGAVCITAADLAALPGPNGVQLLDDSWPVLADGEVRHVGQAVALVAAPTRLGALAARDAVEVVYTPLAPVLTLEEAVDHPPLSEIELVEGDVEAALAAAEVVVEGTWATGHQEHIYIEPHAMTAWLEDEGGEGGGTLTVVGTMQCPYYVHKALKHVFGLADERVRVEASAVGGGFGGKEDYPSLIAIHAALLARAAGRPVRLTYDRHEDIVATTKRHPAVVRHTTGASRDGTLRAMDIEVVMDGGAFRTLSPVVLSRAVLHATGPYRCPAVRIRGRVLATHTAPNGAFRGFGAPQTQLAGERQMDRLARKVGLDPFEIRWKNALEPGDRLPTGQVMDVTTSARLCLETVEAKTDFRRRWHQLEKERARRGDGEPLPGLGLSLYFHGAGFTGNGERRMRSPVTVRLLDDGRVEVATAMTDMGQGCAAIFPQIAQAASGLAADDLVFTPPDTARVPDSGPTVASRTTMVVGGTLARALGQLRDRVLDWWTGTPVRGRRGPAEGAVARIEDGRLVGAGEPVAFREAARRYLAEVGPLEITLHHEPPSWQTFDETTYHGAAYPTYAWGADVAEVVVDPDTLAVKPLEITAVCEVGRAIHPRLCAGQIEGGTLQAVGWALIEEVKLDAGRYLNDRLATYILPTAKDSPKIEVHLLERPWEGGPFGAKGVGELPMDGAAPAVVQAIENATGIEPVEIPATPEKLFAWREEHRR